MNHLILQKEQFENKIDTGLVIRLGIKLGIRKSASLIFIRVLDCVDQNAVFVKGEASPSIYADWVNGGWF